MKRFILALLVSGVLLISVPPPVQASDCILRQSDAVEVVLGPYVDATDGVTAETALTISQGDVILKKCAAAGDCSAAAQKNETGACAHDANGMYECDFNTTDTDTVGILEIWSFESGAVPVFKSCLVVEEAVFDKDWTSGASGIIGTAQTGDSFARLGAPVGASLSADLQVIDTNVDDIETDTGSTLDDLVDDLESRLGTPSNLGGGATVAGNLSDIEGQTDDIGAAGVGLTVLATQASVNTVDDFVDTEVAAILDDTGTTGVVLAETTSNCREVLGCDTQGTLSGTHTTLTADLGTNAPANDITGMTLIVPTHNFARVVDSYNTGTGVVTWVDATSVTLADSNQYYLYSTAPGVASVGGGGGDATEAKQDTILANLAIVDTVVDAILVDTGTTLDDLVDDLETRIGTPSNLGTGATVAANMVDVEGQTDDIGAAGAGLTAADDTVMARLGAPAGASMSADIAAVEAQTDDIGTAGAGLTVLATQASVTVIDDLLDTEIDAILADTNELQTDWANGGRLDNIIDATLADTNELQIDWVNGGRLDLLLDAIKAKTDPLTFTLTNFLQVDTQYMNAVELLGAGTAADPWNGE